MRDTESRAAIAGREGQANYPRPAIRVGERLFVYAAGVPCDFCRSPFEQWRYPTTERDLLACDKCATAIEADDREALLERVLLAPVPRSVRDRHAPQYRQRARELHDSFWAKPRGPAESIPRDRE